MKALIKRIAIAILFLNGNAMALVSDSEKAELLKKKDELLGEIQVEAEKGLELFQYYFANYKNDSCEYFGLMPEYTWDSNASSLQSKDSILEMLQSVGRAADDEKLDALYDTYLGAEDSNSQSLMLAENESSEKALYSTNGSLLLAQNTPSVHSADALRAVEHLVCAQNPNMCGLTARELGFSETRKLSPQNKMLLNESKVKFENFFNFSLRKIPLKAVVDAPKISKHRTRAFVRFRLSSDSKTAQSMLGEKFRITFHIELIQALRSRNKSELALAEAGTHWIQMGELQLKYSKGNCDSLKKTVSGLQDLRTNVKRLQSDLDSVYASLTR